MCDKNVFLISDEYIFYEDFTYRCSNWHPEDVSRWKIIDNKLYFSHHHFNDSWSLFEIDNLLEKLKARYVEIAENFLLKQ